ncbi:hypothetical protein B7463_g11661, partial [Scytalidium lignicola]
MTPKSISFDSLVKHENDFTKLLMMETGLSMSSANGEVRKSIMWFRAHLRFSLPEITVRDDSTVKIITRYTPLGVTGIITPWNAPLLLAVGKILPALITGCPVIIKPSPFSPYTALKLVELGNKFLPPGVIQVLSGDEQLGPWMVSHKNIAKISFTSSTTVGKRIAEAAAPLMKRLTLELGGNDAAIILPDVDIPTAAMQVTMGFQRMPPLLSQSKTNCNSKVKAFYEDCVKRGFRFAFGDGNIDTAVRGYFCPLTIVDNPPDDSMIVSDEPFGPIVPVQPWEDEIKVIEPANNTSTGLGASVWTRDPATADRIARQMEAGNVGHKESGLGGEFGEMGLASYLHISVLGEQVVCATADAGDFK